jgi:hypothetical protein
VQTFTTTAMKLVGLSLLLAAVAHAQETQPALPRIDPNRLAGSQHDEQKTEREPPPLELRPGLQFGYHYDSNVARIGKGVPLPPDEDQHGDAVFGLLAELNAMLRFHHKHPKTHQAQSLVAGAGVDTFHGWHHNWSTEDRNVYGGQAFANWGFWLPPGEGTDFYLGLFYDYDHVRRNRDAFVDVHSVTPTLTMVWDRNNNDTRWNNETTRTMLYFNHEWRDYHEPVRIERLRRDGVYWRAGVQHVHDLAMLKALPFLRDYRETLREAYEDDPYYVHEALLGHVGYSFQTADTDGREFDGVGHELSAGLHIPLKHYFALDLDGAWTWSDYTGRSYYDIHRRHRQGFGQRYSVALTRTWTRFTSSKLELLEFKLGFVAGLELDDANIVARFGNPYDRERWFAGVVFSIDWIPLAAGWQKYIPTGASATEPGRSGIREATSRLRRTLSNQAGPTNTATRASILNLFGARRDDNLGSTR